MAILLGSFRIQSGNLNAGVSGVRKAGKHGFSRDVVSGPHEK